MEKIDYVQSAAFGIWVRAGAVNENEKNAGVSLYRAYDVQRNRNTECKNDCRGY